jgi:type I restriction enzyme S subunit
MSFPRYPKYKASGVEWLGDVPAHWAVPLIKRTTYLKARVGWKGLTSEEFRDNAYAYLVTGSDFREKFVEWDKCYQVERDRYEDDPFIQLENGDLLITKDGTIGKLAIVSGLDRPACLNSGIFVVRPRNTYSTPFMYWILSSRVFSVFCDLKSFGCTINHLYQNVLERFAFPAPPESEQTAIAEFLDRETGKIDELVAEQRRLMELLKEKRQAVISHAVTKGLNPHAPMKPSGIEWLGEVPVGWEVKRLRFVTNLNPSKSEVSALDRGTAVSFLPMEAVGDDGSLALDNEKTIGELETGYTYFRDGDVTIAKITPCYENGKGALMRGLTNGIGFGTTELIVARPMPLQATGAYLHYLFISPDFRDIGESHMYGAGGQKRVPDAFVRNFATAVPPIPEQVAIAEFLTTELAKFDTLTAEAQRAIDLLQERRTALISAAVTGQIDVRQTPRLVS